MALSDINKDELQAFAEEVNVDTEGKKDAIVQRLEDGGYTEEDVEAFQNGTFQANADDDGDDEKTADDRVAEKVGLVDTGDDAREADDDDEDKILIKLDGPFSSITTHGVRFTQTHPFVPVKRSVADELLKSRNFRQAHPGEADEFYS